MNRLFYPILLWILVAAKVFAQQESCNCAENLNTIIKKTEENYAGFSDKVNNKTRSDYTKLVKELEKQASNETHPKKCFIILKAYVRFFRDKHFILGYANENDKDVEIISFSEEQFRASLAKKQKNAIEGIWMNADSTLTFAIQQFSKNLYKGIVLYSKDEKIPVGLVFMTLTPHKNEFILQQYDSYLSTDEPAKQKGNLLQVWNNMYGKIYPTSLSQKEKEEFTTWKNNNKGLYFKQLSTKTAYLKVPSFGNNEVAIQQLVAKNDSIIKNCDNLIVDLTGNGGGSTGWVAFLPYFMTNPIVQYDTFVRVTPENVQAKRNDLSHFVLYPIPEEYKKYFPKEVVAQYKKAYEELPTTQKTFYPIPGVTFPLENVFPKPSKIALIVDSFSGSSSEYFFQLSKQSKKTVRYGIPTVGMMDYEGMSIPTAMPYDKFVVTIPIVKSNWTDSQPIDETGCQPDVLLDKIDYQNWVEYVQKELEKR